LLVQLRQYIDHPGILCLIKAWISSGILSEQGLNLPKKGIPQGSVISPLLANIYLDKFDHTIANSDIKLVRYADDFLILARTQERIRQAYSEVVDLLDSLKLNINRDKTQITDFEHGFCFLGHGFLENAIFPVDKPKKKQGDRKTQRVGEYLSTGKKKVQTQKSYNQKKKKYLSN
jgi:RNA-directed DNA polymerase